MDSIESRAFKRINRQKKEIWLWWKDNRTCTCQKDDCEHWDQHIGEFLRTTGRRILDEEINKKLDEVFGSDRPR